MKKGFALALVLAVAGALAAQAAEYPARDITNVVVWAAGGGTDVCNRIVSAEMQKVLNVRINVTNRTGGVGGSIGMLHVLSQPADGYTLAGISESVVTAGVQGGWDKTMDVWYPFIIGGSPDLVSVTPDSPYKTIQDLIEAAKKAPNTIKISASAAGSIHHLNVLAMEAATGTKFNYIPYQGSAPAQTAAMTGEVSVVVTSLAEQQQLLKGAKLRPLGMLTPDKAELDGVGTIPSAFTAYPDLAKRLPIMQAIGLAIRNDAPANVKQALTNAFNKAMQSEPVKKWLKENYYAESGKSGEEARKEFAKLESLFAWTLWDLKAAKVDPATLKIPKP
ncbi:MAG: tripartite tricarboxylate transporter substrate binding protein [Zetaproteobacteria bacterium]|nr:MAG: tripartite tricarboxylate transporter substrate binding protein [Zetaproteobacteria bacterium]